MALSKNGQYLATGYETTQGVSKVEAIIWNLDEAINSNNTDENKDNNVSLVLHRLSQHQKKVQALDFSCDSQFLVTLGGQDDNDIVVWDTSTGEPICGSRAANDTSHCVSWLNRRNDRFVSCGNYHVRVWQVCTTSTPKLHAVDVTMGGSCMRRVMTCMDISYDDMYAFIGSTTGEVMKFNITREEMHKSYKDPDKYIPSLDSYSRDRFGRGVKSVVCIVNPATGNTNVIVGAGDGVVQLLNPKLERIISHQASLVGGVTSLSLNPSASGQGCQVQGVYVGTNVSQRYYIPVHTFKPELRGTGHYGDIYDVTFPSACSELFITSSKQDIRIWNINQMAELVRIELPNLVCYAIKVTSSGSTIVSAWSDGKIRAFFPQTGKVKYIIPDAHSGCVKTLAACCSSPVNCNDDTKSDFYTIVSGGDDGRVRIWKITNAYQRLIHSMKEHKGTVSSIAVNGDGTQAVSASTDGSCIVWDIIKGIRILAFFDSTSFTSILLHPDESQYVTCGSNCKISYWDAFDGSVIRTIQGGDDCMTCLDIPYNYTEISNDNNNSVEGTYFVSGCADKLIKVWDYDQGKMTMIGKGHSGKINKVAISPDESKLVSVGQDGAIFIWSLQ